RRAHPRGGGGPGDGPVALPAPARAEAAGLDDPPAGPPADHLQAVALDRDLDEVVDGLEDLRLGGLPLPLVERRARAPADQVLEALALPPLVDVIVAGDHQIHLAIAHDRDDVVADQGPVRAVGPARE